MMPYWMKKGLATLSVPFVLSGCNSGRSYIIQDFDAGDKVTGVITHYNEPVTFNTFPAYFIRTPDGKEYSFASLGDLGKVGDTVTVEVTSYFFKLVHQAQKAKN